MNVSEVKNRIQKIDSLGRSMASAKRKASVAVAWISESKSDQPKITVNNIDIKEYFPVGRNAKEVFEPLSATGRNFDVKARCSGGGKSGQAGALKLTIAEAMVNFDPNLYTPLRANGLMTVDIRVKERRKPGNAGAARAKRPSARR